MKNLKSKSILASVLVICLLFCAVFTGCGPKKEEIFIFTSVEDYVVEDLSACLEEKFPEYDIQVVYISTGDHAAKLLAEGTATDCDITYDLEYAYMTQLDQKGIFADLSSYDKSIYMQDTVASDNFIVQCRNSGAIVINTDTLKKKGLSEPTSYEDLLKPEYKGLISMPDPKSSGTGYMFLKSQVNAWGEEEAFDYYDKFTDNVYQYTTSGAGPVNALVQGEAAIGLGMTAQAVTQINQGAPLKICFFEEGSPFTLYGQAIIKGKEQRESVRQVFDYLINEYSYRLNEKFFPEQIFKDKTYSVENYPQNIVYADMSNNTIEEKTRLLDKWKY